MPASGGESRAVVATLPPSAGINPAPHRFSAVLLLHREAPSPCGAGFMPASGGEFRAVAAALLPSAGINPAPHRFSAVLLLHRGLPSLWGRLHAGQRR